MKRLAIFVEVFTEMVFVERLIGETAADKNIEIQTVRGVGLRNKRTYKDLRAISLNAADKYFVLVYNSCGDRSVGADF